MCTTGATPPRGPRLRYTTQSIDSGSGTVAGGDRVRGQAARRDAIQPGFGPVGAEQGLTVIGIWLVVFTLGSVVCMIARVDISE